MSILIRPANLETERGILIEAIDRWLSPRSGTLRYDWLYRNCPHGPAHVWVATQGKGGPLVGVAAAFPRQMYFDGIQKIGCVLGDFFVAAEYRSLGPAISLQRACLGIVGSNAVGLCYDFPAAAMLAVYRRLSIEPAAQLVRMAKPLRADRKIRAWVKSPAIARGLSETANRILRIKNRVPAKNDICEISLHEKACGEEFTTLARFVSNQHGICAERSAAYLNWRYTAHWNNRYEFVTALRQERLLAYLVFTQKGEDASIVDLFGVDKPEVLSHLVAQTVEILRQRSVVTVNCSLLERHRWKGIFKNLGFHERGSCPVILHVAQVAGGKHQPPIPSAWHLMDGDRES